MAKGRSEKTESRLPDAKERSALLKWNLANPMIRLVLLTSLVASLVSLLAPYRFDQTLPVEGTVAQRNYYASHAFEVNRPNPDYEEQVRRAGSRVLPAYSYRAELGQETVALLKSRFAEARGVLANHSRELEELKGAYEQALVTLRQEFEAEITRRESSKAGGEQGAQNTEAERALLKEELQEKEESRGARHAADVAEAGRRLASQIESLREAFPREDLALKLDNEVFQALLDAEFPETGEKALLSAITATMAERIVRNSEVRRLEEDLLRGIQVSVNTESPAPWKGRLDYISEEVARLEASESLRRKLAALGGELPADAQRAMKALVELLVLPNFSYDSRATVAAKVRATSGVSKESTEMYQKGQAVLRAGEQVTPYSLSVLTRMQQTASTPEGTRSILGLVFFTLTALLLFWVLAERGGIRLYREPRDAVLFGVVTVTCLAIVKLSVVLSDGFLLVWPGIPESALFFAMPFALGSMLIRLFLGVPAGTAFSIVNALLVGVLFQDERVGGFSNSLPQILVLYALISGLVGTYAMYAIRERTTLLRASFIVGGTNVIASSVFLLLHGAEFGVESLWVMGGGLFGGISSYVFLMTLIPAFEAAFRYTTDIKLLELANMNHPSLKELAIRAPGTYHHSIMVGNLAEAAAEAIGANPLFARVGAYYHDLGKMRNPRYFAENQGGENPHDKLRPSMSALIVKSHVKDGVEIAKQYRLPQGIIDFIPQHHGTSLIKFFYVRAQEMAEEQGANVDEEDFRYTGPKPQRVETALVMLADGVEASARALSDPNPARLKGLVNKIVRTQFIDGQLDECDLSFRDLNVIVKSFNRVLNGMYHGRPEYPNLPDSKGKGIGLDVPRVGEAGGNSGSILGDEPEEMARGNRATEG